jgi:ABC-type polysaccharide/polyol phosphate transport system ATPase subunit
MNNVAIQLIDITKKYTIHHEKPTLVEKFIKGRDETFTALNNINLTIRKGEKVGIIGPNGSGKTTLLKIIAGITTPTSGNIKTYGKIVSLIDLEAGFHPDLTGYQNIYLNSMLLGMKKRETDKKLRNIIVYADIRQFIDTPMFMYSEGMKLRLGFAIAIHTNPDIFILDEGISVGDAQFQTKAEKTINNMVHQNKTILIVSHYKKIFRNYASRIIYLQKGVISDDGGLSILNKYFHEEK